MVRRAHAGAGNGRIIHASLKTKWNNKEEVYLAEMRTSDSDIQELGIPEQSANTKVVALKRRTER